MRTYDQLTKEEQEEARDIALKRLLSAIVQDLITFDDPDLQERIDTAFEKANAMKTPWFSHEYIMETCEEDLMAMAVAAVQAENTYFMEPGEQVFRLSNN